MLKLLLRPPILCLALMLTSLLFVGYQTRQFLTKALSSSHEVIETFQRNWNKNFETKVFSTEQKRKNICKQYWFRSENSPTTVNIQSSSSTLHLSYDGKKLTMYEDLENLKGFFQEKIETTTTRLVQAKHAQFDYRSLSLHSKQVYLKIYKHPSLISVDKIENSIPDLQGIAQKITLDLNSDPPKFWAVRFSADIIQPTKE